MLQFAPFALSKSNYSADSVPNSYSSLTILLSKNTNPIKLLLFWRPARRQVQHNINPHNVKVLSDKIKNHTIKSYVEKAITIFSEWEYVTTFHPEFQTITSSRFYFCF